MCQEKAVLRPMLSSFIIMENFSLMLSESPSNVVMIEKTSLGHFKTYKVNIESTLKNTVKIHHFINFLNPFTLIMLPHPQAFRGIKENPDIKKKNPLNDG